MLSIRTGLRLIALTVAMAGLVRASSAHAAGLMIGYVDLQRAILEVDEGKRAKASLKKAFEKKKVKIKAEEEKLLKLRDEIRAEAAVKKDEEVRARAMDYEKKRLELQEALMREQKELQELEQKELAGITKKMRSVVEEIGKSGGYTLILELQDARLLYAKQHLDLTNEVIRKYNGLHK